MAGIFFFVKDRGGDPLDSNAIGDLPSIDLPDFILDAEVNEKRQTVNQWTEFPVETGAIVSDFRWTKPEIYEFEGPITTLNPLGAPRGKQGVTTLSERAVQILRDGVSVTVVFGFWTKDLYLESIEQTRSQTDGEALTFRVKLREIIEVTTQAISIAPSRLRRKIRRKASPKKKGGALDKLSVVDLPATRTLRETIVSGTAELRNTELVAKPTFPLGTVPP